MRLKRNVPNLRFKEFSGEWEEKRLEEIMNFSEKRINASTLTTSNYISTENMLQDFQGVIEAKSVPNNTNVISFTYGDILISNIRPYLKKVWKASIDGGCSSDVLVMKANDKINNDYLHYVIANNRFINFVMNGAKGVKMPRGDKEQMKTYIISLPPMVKEQRKIATFLSLLDERIATQNKIIEELKQLKNGISSNLLTNRSIFDKQITLSDCGTLKNGYAFKSSTYDLKGKYSIITIANVTGARFIESVDCNKVTKIPEDIQPHQILCYGDILISLTGNVGRVSLCTDGHFLLNQRVGLFELSDSIDKEFIYQVLSSKHFENEMIAKGQGAAQMNINKNDVESYVIPYSTNIQNIRIVSSLLKSLDEKILTMEHLLLSYDKQKQHLLRQMFI